MIEPSKKIIYQLFLSIILLFVFNTIEAQNSSTDSLMHKFETIRKQLFYKNFDTTYIKSYSHKLNIHLLADNKFSFFQVNDKNLGTNLYYRPELGISLGGGLAYKWFAFNLTFSSWTEEKSEITSSDLFDFQIRMHSSKQYIEATLQYYYGYKLSAVSSHYSNISDEFKAREDMRSIHLNLQYLFAFNYSKFSLKAPFIFNETQQKSAGSVVTGAAFTMYVFDADSSIVPNSISDSFDSKLQLRDFNSVGISVNLGYMYSFVAKKQFFYTIGIIPGLDLNTGDYFVNSRLTMDPNLSFRVKLMNSLGYNGDKIYTGIQFIGNAFSVRLDKKLKANIGYGKLGFIFGYRF